MKYMMTLSVVVFLSMACRYVPPPTSPTVVPPPVVVDNPPPVIPPPTTVTLTIRQSPMEIYAGEGASLFAHTMTGEVRGPATYVWAFGDGATDTTEFSSTGHVYAQAGSYNASVRLTDRDGRETAASTTVTVNRRPSPPRDPPPPPDPPPSLGVRLTCTPRTAPTPTPCNVTATYDGATLRSQDVTNVDWDWGDGESESTPGPSQSHAYAQGGTYTIFAEVTANTKNGSRTAERQLTITVP